VFKSIGLALSFLTCLPVNPGAVDSADLRRAVTFFPFAGLVLGLIITGFSWAALTLHAPPLVLAVAVTGLLAWLTRGLHLDGVADLADGFGGSLEPGRRLEIMKDSSTGAFGVVALVVLLLLKTATLFHLFDYGLSCLPILLMAPISARFWMIVTAARATYPRDTGTGHFIIGQVTFPQLLLSSLFLAPLCLAVLPCLAVIVCSCLPAFFLRLRANKLLGGVTGDVLGGVTEWSEACGLLGGLLCLGMLT
jgi:adenosylcobinamide-GDP ribazoletransferase